MSAAQAPKRARSPCCRSRDPANSRWQLRHIDASRAAPPRALTASVRQLPVIETPAAVLDFLFDPFDDERIAVALDNGTVLVHRVVSDVVNATTPATTPTPTTTTTPAKAAPPAAASTLVAQLRRHVGKAVRVW